MLDELLKDCHPYTYQAWPAWYFGPNNQSGVFDRAEDVPEGWVDHPSKLQPAEPEASARRGRPPKQSESF